MVNVTELEQYLLGIDIPETVLGNYLEMLVQDYLNVTVGIKDL